MSNIIFGKFATVIIAASLLSFTQHEPQDQQQKKRTEQRQKDKNRDTMSNRRIHDEKVPPAIDSIPERNPAVPMPDTINKHMH